MRRKPEILAPAGDMEKLQMAVLYGADAVYLAGTSFGMRSFAGNFTPEELPKAVKFAHDHGVRVHVTVNTMPRNDEVARLPEHLERLNDAGVDALILADLGAFTLAGKYATKCERHISTQQSIANYECARAWYDLGAKRVVLAREVSLQEIREMRAKIPEELEVETFCHGAMCVSYSGRCLLSNYMTGRDSNRGQCAQPCRYQYALMEEKRPGEYFPVFEDEKGTYIMNSRDMCMIDHLDDIMDAGIDCIKIEGRAKSAYYAAIVTGAYRHVLDDVAAGREVDPVWRDEVEHVSHRHYSTGFYYGQPGQYYDNSPYIHSGGKVKDQAVLWENICPQDTFLEAMADAASTVADHFAGKIAYVAVMKNLSVDCDCCAVAENPCMGDIGILSSLDPVALDRACLDLVEHSADPGRDHFMERVNSRHGAHTIEAAEALGVGTTEYELVRV